MFIIKLLRLIFGYVEFKAWGNFVERFLNLASNNGILFWDIIKRDEILYAKVLARDYKKLRKICKKTHVRCKILKKKGFPFRLNKYKKRVGFLIGLIIFCGFLFFMSRFIWSIEITGNVKVETDKIMQTLEENGVKIGVLKKDINYRNLENQLMIQLEELSWIGMTTKGSSLKIDVKERIMPPTYLSDKIACNIKAKKDGQIIRMEVYEGQKVLRVGDVVMKGDLIVKGILEDSRGNTSTMVHSRAKIFAKTEVEQKISIPINITEKKYTDSKNRYKINILNFKIPLYFKQHSAENTDIETSTTQLSIFGIAMPIYLEKINIKPYIPVDVTLTEEQAKEKAFAQLDDFEKENLKDIKVINKIVDGKIENEQYLLSVLYKCEEDIAVEEAIDIEIK